jgi:hypothetical protein
MSSVNNSRALVLREQRHEVPGAAAGGSVASSLSISLQEQRPSRHVYEVPNLESRTSFDQRHQHQQDYNGRPQAPNPLKPKQAHMAAQCPDYPLGKSCSPVDEAMHSTTLDAMVGQAAARIRHFASPTNSHGHTHSHVPALKSGLTLHWRHPVKDPGVLFVFQPKQPRRFRSASAHYLGSHHYLVPAEQALLVMSGAHDKPELFAEILFDEAHDDDMVKTVCDHLQRGAFISPACLNLVVHTAAAKGMTAQVPNERQDARDLDANRHLYRAHRLISAYLIGLKTDSMRAEARSVLESVVSALQQPTGGADGRNESAYAGIVAGLCLAGVVRFFKDELARGIKEQERFTYAVSILSTGLGFVPLAGSYVSAAINLIGPTIVKRALATKDSSEHVLRLGASIEDGALRVEDNRFDAREFNTQLEKSMRHCGFPY